MWSVGSGNPCCRPGCRERAQILPNVSCSDGGLSPSHPAVTTCQPREGCALCPLEPEEIFTPTGKRHRGYQHIGLLGPLLAPTCDYHVMLGQARSSPHRTVLFAVKDHTKKPAVPRIKSVEEKHPKNSLDLNVHELKLKQT